MITQHPFINQAKPVTILRDLITEAMEMKAKKQQEQQREMEEEDDNSVRVLTSCCSNQLYVKSTCLIVLCLPGRGDGGGLSHYGEVRF